MVRVSLDEKEQIEQAAGQCDLSAPAYLRKLGLGHQPQSNADNRAVELLAHLHGDVGRVGGLLKMWLSTPEKKGFGQHLNVPDLINQLLDLQREIREVAEKL